MRKLSPEGSRVLPRTTLPTVTEPELDPGSALLCRDPAIPMSPTPANQHWGSWAGFWVWSLGAHLFLSSRELALCWVLGPCLPF